MDFLLVLVAGLFAGTLGGIVGTGSSLVLMPILVVMFGPRQAVPIMFPLSYTYCKVLNDARKACTASLTTLPLIASASSPARRCISPSRMP